MLHKQYRIIKDPVWHMPINNYQVKNCILYLSNLIINISDFYIVRPYLHLGMNKKPLSRYDPNAYRSMLPIEDCKMAANNASSIIIGDRT